MSSSGQACSQASDSLLAHRTGATTTAPTLGHSGPSRKRRPVFSSWKPASWIGGAVWCIERIRLNLSVSFASFGNSSLRCSPGTFVWIGWNGPRTSRGASGFGSNVSRWLGPPTMLMKMQLFAVPSGARAFAAAIPGIARPAAPAAAVLRNSRRDGVDMGQPRGWWRAHMVTQVVPDAISRLVSREPQANAYAPRSPAARG